MHELKSAIFAIFKKGLGWPHDVRFLRYTVFSGTKNRVTRGLTVPSLKFSFYSEYNDAFVIHIPKVQRNFFCSSLKSIF